MSIDQFLAKRGLPLDMADTSQWPELGEDESLVPIARSARYVTLKRAIVYYCSGSVGLRTVAQEAEVSEARLRNILARCFTLDELGRPYGFAALVPYKHLRSYTRRSKSAKNYSGAFEALLDTYQLRNRLVNIILGRDKSYGIVRRLVDLHEILLRLLETAGASTDEYPFTVQNQGCEGLRRFRKAVKAASAARAAAIDVSPEVAAALSRIIAAPDEPPARLYPYERVELDGHRIDGIFTVHVPGLDGVPLVLTAERLWVIALIELVGRAILGYMISLNPEPSKDDVAEAITRSIVPQPRRPLTLQDLRYPDCGGFPAADVPGCAYRLFDHLVVDNAKAHWATALREDLCRKAGAILHIPPGGRPADRRYIEGVFRTFEEQLFHRFGNTTGSSPADPRRRDAEAAAIALDFHIDEAYQLADVYFAKVNGAPPPGAPRAAPLQHLANALRASPILDRRVALNERKHWNLHTEWETGTVRASREDKRPPYLQWKNARYRSKRLKRCWHLVGKKLRIKINRMDVSRLEAYLEDGTPFDTLRAIGYWGFPHSYYFHQLYAGLMKVNEFTRVDDPVLDTKAFLEKRALSSKRARNQLKKVCEEFPDANSTKQDQDSGARKPEPSSTPSVPDPRLARVSVPRQVFY